MEPILTLPVSTAPLPGCGLPQERLTRQAAQRAFAQMRQYCERSLVGLYTGDTLVGWLRNELRRSSDVDDLWRLQVPLLTALRRDRVHGSRRHDLQQRLRQLFPDSMADGGFFADPVQDA